MKSHKIQKYIATTVQDALHNAVIANNVYTYSINTHTYFINTQQGRVYEELRPYLHTLEFQYNKIIQNFIVALKQKP